MIFEHHSIYQFPELRRIHLGNRRFYITPEGKKYPSMTTVLDDKPKPWLNKWREKIGIDEANEIMRAAAERGTQMQRIIENHLHNKKNPASGFSDYHTKSFNQIKPLLNKINNIVGLEVGLYSDDLRLAGSTDCIAEYEGVFSIIDFKGSLKKKTKSNVTDYFIQCAGYATCFNEKYDKKIENIVIIMCVDAELTPRVFVEKVDTYLEPLVKRVVEYHQKHK